MINPALITVQRLAQARGLTPEHVLRVAGAYKVPLTTIRGHTYVNAATMKRALAAADRDHRMVSDDDQN